MADEYKLSYTASEIDNKLSKIPNEVDPLAMLTEGGFINPVANKNNAIYIDENGAIFSI